MKYKLEKFTTPNLSVEIRNFIKMLDQAKKDYEWNTEQVKTFEKRESDIRHKFELERLSENEKRRLTTEFTYVLRQRRIHKDIIEATQPISDFLNTDQGRKFCNTLKEVQGKTSKIEKYHKTRQYQLKSPLSNK